MGRFELRQLGCWLVAPSDPSGLGLIRIILMWLLMHDMISERSDLLGRFAQNEKGVFVPEVPCQFPLFDSWTGPGFKDGELLVAVGTLAAFCAVLGLFYRFSMLAFACIHWYFVLLDKTTWTNHSILFGVLAVELLLMDGHNWASVDGICRKRRRNREVPRWQYLVLQVQCMIVYQIAAFRKITSTAWTSGLSAIGHTDSKAWDSVIGIIGTPLAEGFLVPYGGMITLGIFPWFLLSKRSRPLAWMPLLGFHAQNYFSLSIGQFPAVFSLLTVLPFVDFGLPRKILSCLGACWILPAPSCVFWWTRSLVGPPEQNLDDCAYDSGSIATSAEARKTEERTEKSKVASGSPEVGVSGEAKNEATTTHQRRPPCKLWPRSRFRFIGTTIFFAFWFILESYLPYSHLLTKGYANWSGGLYGIGLDMFLDKWRTDHVRLSANVRHSDGHKETIYLDPTFFARPRRWSSHPDMTKQFGLCVEKVLLQNDPSLKKVEVFVDVWTSLNKRFTQRVYNSDVDLVRAPWSVFETPPWFMPLVELPDVQESLSEADGRGEELLFVADFPGMQLRRHLPTTNSVLVFQLLEGQVQFTQGCATPDAVMEQEVAPGPKMWMLQDYGHLEFTPARNCTIYPAIGEKLVLGTGMTHVVLVQGKSSALYSMGSVAKPKTPSLGRFSVLEGVDGFRAFLKKNSEQREDTPETLVVAQSGEHLEELLRNLPDVPANSTSAKLHVLPLTSGRSATIIRREFAVGVLPMAIVVNRGELSTKRLDLRVGEERDGTQRPYVGYSAAAKALRAFELQAAEGAVRADPKLIAEESSQEIFLASIRRSSAVMTNWLYREYGFLNQAYQRVQVLICLPVWEAVSHGVLAGLQTVHNGTAPSSEENNIPGESGSLPHDGVCDAGGSSCHGAPDIVAQT